MAETAEPVGNGVKEDTEQEEVPMESEQTEADLAAESAPAEDKAVTETTEKAVAETTEKAPAETSEKAPTETSEKAPTETTEKAPTETTEKAPTEGEEKTDAPVEGTPTKTDDDKKTPASEEKIGNKVAKHYNELQESGVDVRTQSKIFYMRNFNNWIKSIAIADTLEQIRKKRGDDAQINVLDLCSGKGGDLLKWKIGRISKLCCADIAGTSVKQCEQRYRDISDRTRRERSGERVYHAEFLTADCTKKRLKDMYRDPSIKFDLTSCQFSFHYSFESYPQADLMLKNACENLRVGGYFIGTTTNAYELVKRLRASEDMSFNNDVYKVTFHTEGKDNLPLFGAKYDFQLEGVVDCPEFLVNFPCLEKMAEKYGMKLIHKTPFTEYFGKMLNKEGRALLGRMQSLEPYPAEEDVELMSSNEESYAAAKKRVWQLKVALAEYMEEEEDRNRPVKVGTLSVPEWQASSLYTVFVFQKTSDPLAPLSESNGDKDGKAGDQGDEEWEVKDEEGGDEEPMEGGEAEEAKTTPDDEAKTTPVEEVKAKPDEEVKAKPDEEAKTTPDEKAKTTPDEEAKTTPDEEAKTTPDKEASRKRKSSEGPTEGATEAESAESAEKVART